MGRYNRDQIWLRNQRRLRTSWLVGLNQSSGLDLQQYRFQETP